MPVVENLIINAPEVFEDTSKSSDYALYTLLKSDNSGKCNHTHGPFPSAIYSCLFCLCIFLGHLPVKAIIAQLVCRHELS